MRNKKIPGLISISIIILCILIISNISSVFIFAGINTFSSEYPKYEARFNDMYISFVTLLKLSPQDIENFKESLNLKNLLLDGSVTATLTNIFSSIVGIFSNFILILVFVIFLLSEVGSIKKRILRAFSEDRAEKLTKTLSDIFSEVRSYLVGKTILNLSLAIVVGFVLWAFGVEFYFIWAFLFFVADYIPYLGAIVLTVLTGITVFLQFDDIFTPVIIFVILIVIQNIKGNLVEPKVLGDKLDLSPIIIILSLLFWGYVWGIVGMILAIPIMSMIKIILMNFDQTKPIAIMMSYNLLSIQEKETVIEKKIKRYLKKKKK
jgi:predicted PurR-regulated permease PerM